MLALDCNLTFIILVTVIKVLGAPSDKRLPICLLLATARVSDIQVSLRCMRQRLRLRASLKGRFIGFGHFPGCLSRLRMIPKSKNSKHQRSLLSYQEKRWRSGTNQ